MTIATPASDPQSRGMPTLWNRDRFAVQAALGGRYVLERELGRGGMGIVYLAWDGSLDRHVALKVLSLGSEPADGRDRFLREARTLARLPHQHIVPIHEVDFAGDVVYFTMEYVQGGTLADRIRGEGRLPVGHVARILREVAHAVHHAHQHGVIHRDLKPQNILLESREGRAMVSDFGIARDFTQPWPAGAGRTWGSSSYISPERILGLEADARSDIYSLGVVGFEAATGVRPFRGTEDQVLLGHLAFPAPALGVLGEHWDPTLGRVLARCLAKRPADRFQSAAELAAALSMASELRRDLSVELRTFLSDSKSTPRPTIANLLVGASAMGALVTGVASGGWIQSALAATFLQLALVQPVRRLLGMARRALRAGHTLDDLIHILTWDVARAREEDALRQSREPTARAVTRRIAWAGGGLFTAGLLLALTGLNLPENVLMGAMTIGGVTASFAGLALAMQETPETRTRRWLEFWRSRRGEWAARFARWRPKRLPSPPGRPAVEPASPPVLRAAREEVLDRTRTTISRARTAAARLTSGSTDSGDAEAVRAREESLAGLADGLARLEAIAEWLETLDPATADPAELTAQFDAVRAIHDAVDALLEAGRGVFEE